MTRIWSWLIVIIVVVAFLAALAVVRRHRRKRRPPVTNQAEVSFHTLTSDEAAFLFGGPEPRWDEAAEVIRLRALQDPIPPILFAIDEAAILFGSYPPSQEELDEVSRQLRRNAKANFVAWHVDLTQGPELGPWPKDGDALFGHRSPSEKAAEVLRRLRQVEPDFTLGTIEGNPNAVEWRIKPDPELGPKDEDGGRQ